MSSSSTPGLMAHNAAKAAAVDRLMPAQQCTTIGPRPPQSRAKSTSRATCSASGAMYPGSGSEMSWMCKRRWRSGKTGSGVSTSTASCRQVRRWDAWWRTTTSGRALNGHTWTAPSLARMKLLVGWPLGEGSPSRICFSFFGSVALQVKRSCAEKRASPLVAGEGAKARQELGLRNPDRHRIELTQTLAQCGRYRTRHAEVAAGLRLAEARERGRLVVGSDAVRRLDRRGDAVGKRRREREAPMDGLEQLGLERLVVEADGRLERADEIADHVLRRIMQQRGEPPAARQVRLHRARDLLHQHGMLGDGEGVLPHRLAVPARNAGQTV